MKSSKRVILSCGTELVVSRKPVKDLIKAASRVTTNPHFRLLMDGVSSQDLTADAFDVTKLGPILPLFADEIDGVVGDLVDGVPEIYEFSDYVSLIRAIYEVNSLGDQLKKTLPLLRGEV